MQLSVNMTPIDPVTSRLRFTVSFLFFFFLLLYCISGGWALRAMHYRFQGYQTIPPRHPPTAVSIEGPWSDYYRSFPSGFGLLAGSLLQCTSAWNVPIKVHTKEVAWLSIWHIPFRWIEASIGFSEYRLSPT